MSFIDNTAVQAEFTVHWGFAPEEAEVRLDSPWRKHAPASDPGSGDSAACLSGLHLKKRVRRCSEVQREPEPRSAPGRGNPGSG